MIAYIIIGILSLLVIVLLYTNYNLLKKNETAEDIIVNYTQYLDKISRVIEFSSKKIEQIDSRGTFKSDDEVGFFFNQIKELQDVLNEFIVKKY
jgi:hypothetical protein